MVHDFYKDKISILLLLPSLSQLWVLLSLSILIFTNLRQDKRKTIGLIKVFLRKTGYIKVECSDLIIAFLHYSLKPKYYLE